MFQGQPLKYLEETLKKLRTPVETINIANGGGLNSGSLIETWGESKGGKSTFCYQTAEYMLEDYPDSSMVLILDAESAVNKIRLKRAFGLDTEKDPRVVVRPAFTLEMGNDYIQQFARESKKSGKLLMVIWDSITASTFKKAYEAIQSSINANESDKEKEEGSNRGATEPMARAQIVKWMLNNCLHLAYDQEIIFFYINQITTKVNKFNVSIDSSGGNALRHNVHERFRFDYVKATGETELYKSGTISRVTVNKSRSIPSLRNIEITIDDSVGGKILPGEELIGVAIQLGLLNMKNGGWYSLDPEQTIGEIPEVFKKSQQKKFLITSVEAQDYLRILVRQYLRKNFSMVDWIYQDLEESASGEEKKAIEKGKKK
jgi:RecA/RadA recombinase